MIGYNSEKTMIKDGRNYVVVNHGVMHLPTPSIIPEHHVINSKEKEEYKTNLNNLYFTDLNF